MNDSSRVNDIFSDKGYSCEEYSRYLVDICKTKEYTDSNGVTWWSDKYQGGRSALEIFSNLKGKVEWLENTWVVDVTQLDNKITLTVDCIGDLSGYYFNPRMVCELSEDKHVKSINYDSITLEQGLYEDYSVEGLLPCRLVEEK